MGEAHRGIVRLNEPYRGDVLCCAKAEAEVDAEAEVEAGAEGEAEAKVDRTANCL